MVNQAENLQFLEELDCAIQLHASLPTQTSSTDYHNFVSVVQPAFFSPLNATVQAQEAQIKAFSPFILQLLS